MLLGQTLFVDPVNGNDATGERQRQDLPFQTIGAALAEAQDYDQVWLLAGQHTISATIDLPQIAHLTIRGAGTSCTVVAAPAGAAFRIADAFVRTSLLIADLSMTGGSQLINVNITPGASFETRNQALTIDRVSVVGSYSISGAGHVVFRSSTFLGATGFATACALTNNSSVEAYDSYLGDLTLTDTRTTFGPLGRGVKAFRSCQFVALVVTGLPLAYFDRTCTVVSSVTVNGQSIAGVGDIAFRFAGFVGRGPAGSSEDLGLVSGPYQGISTVTLVTVNIGPVAGTTTWVGNGSNVFSGIDLSGAIINGRLVMTSTYPTSSAQPQYAFMGAKGASLGDITLSCISPPLASPNSNRTQFGFRGCLFRLRVDTTTITCNHGDVDLRGSCLERVTLVSNPDDPAVWAAFDRDYVSIAATSVAALTGSIAINPKFPSNVSNRYDVLATAVGPSTAVITASAKTNESFTYTASATGGQMSFRLLRT